MTAPTILALDLSLTCTGWCYCGTTGLIKPANGVKGVERLAGLAQAVLAHPARMRSATMLMHGIDVAVLEGYSYASPNGAHQAGELGGVVRLELHRNDVPFAVVPPTVLKKYATGNGGAGKDEMLAAAIRRFGYQGTSNDEADAFLLWNMALDAYGHALVKVPEERRERLWRRIEWPAVCPPSAETAPSAQVPPAEVAPGGQET